MVCRRPWCRETADNCSPLNYCWRKNENMDFFLRHHNWAAFVPHNHCLIKQQCCHAPRQWKCPCTPFWPGAGRAHWPLAGLWSWGSLPLPCCLRSPSVRSWGVGSRRRMLEQIDESLLEKKSESNVNQQPQGQPDLGDLESSTKSHLVDTFNNPIVFLAELCVWKSMQKHCVAFRR